MTFVGSIRQLLCLADFSLGNLFGKLLESGNVQVSVHCFRLNSDAPCKLVGFGFDLLQLSTVELQRIGLGLTGYRSPIQIMQKTQKRFLKGSISNAVLRDTLLPN